MLEMDIYNVMKAMPNFVSWKNKSLIYTGCNQNFANLLDLPSCDMILGKNDNELPWMKHFSEQSVRYDQEAILSGQPKVNVNQIISLQNGRVIDVLVDRIPFLNEQGKTSGVLIIATESQKRNLSDQIFFEHILKSVPYCIFWKNKDSVYLGSNNDFAKLLGFNSGKEIIGLTDADFHWGSGEINLFREADRKVMEGDPYVNVEESLVRPDGSEITMLVSKVPVRNNEGDVIGILGISTDITNIKQTERELKEAKEKAELANKIKSEFIASMSHDLRTPLNVILGTAEIFRLRQHRLENEEFINAISQAGKNLLNLIEDVLSFSKLEAGRFELHLEKINFKKIVDDSVAMLKLQISQKGLKFDFSYDSNIPKTVITDFMAIRRIIFNLLSNAIKFTDHGQISLELKMLEKSNETVKLELSVRDTGIGIPENRLNDIFERFSRVQPSYKSRYEGVGLGLNIVKQLLESLGGSISVHSQLGEGSKFVCVIPLQLPRYDKHAVKKSENEVGKEHYKTKKFKLKILLVEDDKLTQKIFKSFLEEFGCKIDVADCGTKALELSSNNYDLIFMDLGLADINGLVVAETIRQRDQNKKQVPIIALTAHASKEDEQKCLDAGMNKFITKPASYQIIKKILEEFTLV